MDQQPKKFYQTRMFRRALAVLLAVILLANDVVEQLPALFAGNNQATEDVVAPESNEGSQPAAPGQDVPPAVDGQPSPMDPGADPSDGITDGSDEDASGQAD